MRSWQGAASRLPCLRSDGHHRRDAAPVPGGACGLLATYQDAWRTAPSPGCAGYFPINGEDSVSAPSPGCAGYFPINGEDSSVSLLVGNGLTHWFGRELALDGVDLVLDTGEHMAVLGDNGAGKTTLLRILATALRPPAGQLQIAGLDAFREKRRLMHHLGFVAHAPGLYPALSAVENLEFFCDLQEESRTRVGDVPDVGGRTAVAAPR